MKKENKESQCDCKAIPLLHEPDGHAKDCPAHTPIGGEVYHTGGSLVHVQIGDELVFDDTSKQQEEVGEKCEHGVVAKYCFNCKFKEKYGMKVEMFNNHHYVRLREVDALLLSQKKQSFKEKEEMYKQGRFDVKVELREKIAGKAFYLKHGGAIDLDIDAIVKLSDVLALLDE